MVLLLGGSGIPLDERVLAALQRESISLVKVSQQGRGPRGKKKPFNYNH